MRIILLLHRYLGIAGSALMVMWCASGIVMMYVPYPRVTPAERQRGLPPIAWEGCCGDLAGGVGAAPAAVRGFAVLPAMTGAASVRMVLLEGELYFVVDRSDGTPVRVDPLGHLAPLTPGDVTAIARRLSGRDPLESVERLGAEDAYYFGPPGAPATLPVWRVVVGEAEHTRHYVDAVSGALLAGVDRNTRGYRWFHQALHRLDAWPALRRRPAWDALALPLLLGALFVCATGFTLGMRRTVGAALARVRSTRSGRSSRSGPPS